jgi:hypothetical protein
MFRFDPAGGTAFPLQYQCYAACSACSASEARLRGETPFLLAGTPHTTSLVLFLLSKEEQSGTRKETPAAQWFRVFRAPERRGSKRNISTYRPGRFLPADVVKTSCPWSRSCPLT